MNRQDQLAAIRQKCIEANPEIAGRHTFPTGHSRCIYCNEPRILIDRKRVLLQRDEKSGGEIAEVTESRIDQTDFRCSEHRGRPIHLVDVLLAIGETKKPIAIDDTGGIWDWQHNDWHGNGRLRYNLRADSLEEQSDDTIAFIHSLLSV